MKRLLAALLFLTSVCLGQNFTTITGSNVQNAGNVLLPAGQISFQGTDNNGNPISFQAGGGGQVITRPVVCTITTGVIAGGCKVANTLLTNPQGVYYTVIIRDTNANQIVLTYKGVQPNGSSWNFDNYAPIYPGVFVPPLGGTVNGNLSINGNLSVTGMITGTFAFPSTVVQTNQANTYTSGLQDFTGVQANFFNLSLTTGAETQTVVAGSGGTTANLLATHDSSGHAILPTLGNGGFGIALSSVSASANVEVATDGTVNCVADNSTTIGHILIPGTTTAGRCKDSGQTSSTAIGDTTPIIGLALSSVSAGSLVSVQLHGIGIFGTQVVAGQLPAAAAQTGVNNAWSVTQNFQAITTPSFNSVLWVGPGTNQYSSIASCYAALPTATFATCSDSIGTCWTGGGGVCMVSPAWTETLSANLVLANNKSIHFMGPATITQGSHQVTMAGGVHGVTIDSVVEDHSQRTSGVTWDYSGSSDQFSIGDGTAGVNDIKIAGMQIHAIDGGNAATALHIQACADCKFADLDLVCSNNSGNTGSGLIADYATYGMQRDIFTGVIVNFCNNPIKIISAADMEFIGLQIEGANGTAGPAIALTGAATRNIFLGTTVNNGGTPYTSLFNFGGTSNGNIATGGNQINGVTATATFGSSSTNNTYHCLGGGCTVSDSSASTSNNAIITLAGNSVYSTGATGAVTGTSADATVYSYTLPANTLQPGRGLRIKVHFLHSTGTTSTAYKLKIGSTTVNTETYAAAGNSIVDSYTYEIYNTNGNQGVQFWSQDGVLNLTGSGVAQILNPATGTSSIDFTASQSILFTFNVANSDAVTGKNFTIEMIK